MLTTKFKDAENDWKKKVNVDETKAVVDLFLLAIIPKIVFIENCGSN